MVSQGTAGAACGGLLLSVGDPVGGSSSSFTGCDPPSTLPLSKANQSVRLPSWECGHGVRGGRALWLPTLARACLLGAHSSDSSSWSVAAPGRNLGRLASSRSSSLYNGSGRGLSTPRVSGRADSLLGRSMYARPGYVPGGLSTRSASDIGPRSAS